MKIHQKVESYENLICLHRCVWKCTKGQKLQNIIPRPLRTCVCTHHRYLLWSNALAIRGSERWMAWQFNKATCDNTPHPSPKWFLRSTPTCTFWSPWHNNSVAIILPNAKVVYRSIEQTSLPPKKNKIVCY